MDSVRFFETVPYCPKAAPNVHGEPQDRPNLARSGPNIAPKRPKMTQHDPKSAGVRNWPLYIDLGPKSSKTSEGQSGTSARPPKKTQGSPEEALKIGPQNVQDSLTDPEDPSRRGPGGEDH